MRYEKMFMKQRCFGEIQEWNDLPEDLCLHPKHIFLKGQKMLLHKNRYMKIELF